MSGDRWLTILGIGADGVEGLGIDARARLAAAALVVGGARHLAMADALIAGERLAWSSPLDAALARIAAWRGRPVVVLASGDPSWFGVAATLAAHVPAAETWCMPAPSSFSLAAARLGWALQDVATISFCGRPLAALAPLLQPHGRILALSADASTPAAVAAYLAAHGFGASMMHVLERLGGADERARTTTAAAFDLDAVDPLNLVALEVVAGREARPIPLACGLDDAAFEHDGQITKREIRAVTLSALAPRRGELLWDVGCGSGSVGIEWMLRHPANRAVAIDADPTRADRARTNATALGVPALRIAVGRAPAALDGLPAPDAVFVGGGGSDPAVLAAAWDALRPEGRIVANAVTVETEAALHVARARWGGALARLSVERLGAVGRMHAWRPAMAVTQWVATKP